MDRLSSPSALAIRTEPLQLMALPEEMIAKIIATIDEVDNQTLTSLAQTCKDLWRIASVDTLRSFFYAAREAYHKGDTSKKAAVFCLLSKWLPSVAEQLPEESRSKFIFELSLMGSIDGIKDLGVLDELKFSILSLFPFLHAESAKDTKLVRMAIKHFGKLFSNYSIDSTSRLSACITGLRTQRNGPRRAEYRWEAEFRMGPRRAEYRWEAEFRMSLERGPITLAARSSPSSTTALTAHVQDSGIATQASDQKKS